MEAVLWLTRNGCRGRALPAKWGNCHTTYTRFQRWAGYGVWAQVLAAVQQDDALRCSWTRLPCGRTSTPVGRAKKRAASRGPQPRRSDHEAACGGRRPRPASAPGLECRPAPRCPTGLATARRAGPSYLIADRGYDADPLVAALAARGTCAVIPPRRKRRHPRAYDAARYAQRHPVERLFSRLKQFRRVATRYDKLDAHFLAFVQLAATVLWLRNC